MKNLHKLSEVDNTVDSILRSGVDHAEAARQLQARDYDFARTSVRRAREKMGVVSPLSPSNDRALPPTTDANIGRYRGEAVFQAPVSLELERAKRRHPSNPDPEYTETFVILPDFQCDLQDDSFLWRALDLVRDVEPDGIIHVGDENDASSISRWTQGTHEEHIPDLLQRQVDVTYQWMKRFRDVESVQQFDVCYSNHGMRFGKSLASRVPGWKDMRVVQYDHIMSEAAEFHGDEPLDINWDVNLVDMIPGTIAGHGDQWNLTSKAQYSQLTNVAMENAKNIIAGHTHRPMLSTVPYRDADGNQQSRFVMNVGHAMDITKADYTNHYRGKTPTWGQAVGLVTVVNGIAHPELVQDHNGSMFYGGTIY